MRNTLRLAVVAAVAAVTLPTAPASAIYCGDLIQPACYKACQVLIKLGRPCPR